MLEVLDIKIYQEELKNAVIGKDLEIQRSTHLGTILTRRNSLQSRAGFA